jgi:two-component system, OmpR family, sensor kinase
LSLAFAIAMAIVLSALGAFLYLRLERSLTEGIDETLELRAAQIESPVSLGSPVEEGVTQAYGADGRLLSSSPSGAAAILGPDDVERGSRQQFIVSRRGQRVLVTTIDSAVVAVTASLDDRDDALDSLLAQLLVVGPLALVLAAIGGYFLAGAALRPVDAMRREAEAVSDSEPGRRLTLPSADDELRSLGETLNSMLARLETALERERRFVADASHELRTPLALLRAELDLALRRERTPEELVLAVRSAAEETERLSRLADDLLVLARAEGGELPVRREAVGAADLVYGIAERFRPRANDAGRTIETSADHGLVLHVDRLRAEQAVGNLVDNALRHGGGEIVIEARRGQNDTVELHVRDEGLGFPPDLADIAFEPFTRGDVARTGPGAGLGLAIVEVIARAHGGSAHVAGADAWLALPGS